MTIIQKFPFDAYEYRLCEYQEETNCFKFRYCSLEEVLYILSQKEGAIDVQHLVD